MDEIVIREFSVKEINKINMENKYGNKYGTDHDKINMGQTTIIHHS